MMPSMAKKPALTLSPETLVATRQLGAALRAARIRRRLTQAQLASRTGTGVATIQRMERGEPGLSIGTLLETLAVLERSWLGELVQRVADDAPGRQMEQRRLPKRVVHREEF